MVNRGPVSFSSGSRSPSGFWCVRPHVAHLPVPSTKCSTLLGERQIHHPMARSAFICAAMVCLSILPLSELKSGDTLNFRPECGLCGFYVRITDFVDILRNGEIKVNAYIVTQRLD